MRKVILIGFFVSIAALCGQDSRTFKVQNHPKLSLGNVSGDIHIAKGGDGQIAVKWTSTDDRITVSADQQGNEVEVKVEYPKNVHNIKGEVSFTITCPDEADLEISSVSGDITVDGVAGKLELQAVSGNIALSDSAGELEVQCVSGNLQLTQIGEAELSAQAVNGSIDYQGSLEGGEYSFNTTSGNITLAVERNASFELSGQAMSGSVTSKFNGVEVTKQEYTGFKTLEGSVNGGKVKVDVSTISGNITIK